MNSIETNLEQLLYVRLFPREQSRPLNYYCSFQCTGEPDINMTV